MGQTGKTVAMPRRSFFGAMMAGGSAWLCAVLGIPTVRAALFPLKNHAADAGWSDLGPVDNFSQSLTARRSRNR